MYCPHRMCGQWGRPILSRPSSSQRELEQAGSSHTIRGGWVGNGGGPVLSGAPSCIAGGQCCPIRSRCGTHQSGMQGRRHQRPGLFASASWSRWWQNRCSHQSTHQSGREGWRHRGMGTTTCGAQILTRQSSCQRHCQRQRTWPQGKERIGPSQQETDRWCRMCEQQLG